MEKMTTELVALLIAVAIYLIRTWLASKNADLDKKAEQIQNVILDAITKTRAMQNTGKVDNEGIKTSEALKTFAIDLVTKEIANNPKVSTAMESLNISIKQ